LGVYVKFMKLLYKLRRNVKEILKICKVVAGFLCYTPKLERQGDLCYSINTYEQNKEKNSLPA